MVPSIEAEAIRGWNSVKDTQQEGVLNDIEALTVIAAGGDVTYDEATTTMYMQKGDQWYSYEDPNSIVKKIERYLQQSVHFESCRKCFSNACCVDSFFDRRSGDPCCSYVLRL